MGAYRHQARSQSYEQLTQGQDGDWGNSPVAFTEDLGSVPSTHVVVQDPTPFFWPPQAPGSHVVHTCAHVGRTLNPGKS